MAIELRPVISSQIAAVGYDPAMRELVIRFCPCRQLGLLYSYYDVPPDLVRGLLSAESKGSYFHHNIRNGKYRFQRHPPDRPETYTSARRT